MQTTDGNTHSTPLCGPGKIESPKATFPWEPSQGLSTPEQPAAHRPSCRSCLSSWCFLQTPVIGADNAFILPVVTLQNPPQKAHSLWPLMSVTQSHQASVTPGQAKRLLPPCQTTLSPSTTLCFQSPVIRSPEPSVGRPVSRAKSAAC